MCIVAATVALSQPTALEAQRQPSTAVADALLAARQRADAVAAFTPVISAEPGNGSAWANLGESQLQLGHFDDAQMKPCTSAPFRQFDFWIGDWDVYGVRGGLAGHNVVTLEQDGCVLVEHWTSSTGGQTGTSLNYYDIRDKQWHQLYIDNSGNAGAFPAMAGTFDDGKMVLYTEDTNNTRSRWTWYLMEPGKVKQMSEVSRDHGKTWQIGWNSVYVAKGGRP